MISTKESEFSIRNSKFAQELYKVKKIEYFNWEIQAFFFPGGYFHQKRKCYHFTNFRRDLPHVGSLWSSRSNRG